MVRSELHYGPDEWRALPWTQQRMFVEQLALHGKFRGEDVDDGEQSLDDLQAAGATVEHD